MSDDLRGRALAAILATIVLVTGIFAYIGNRDKLADGVTDRLLEHGENNSMIASTEAGPSETRFDVFWRCEGEAEKVRTVYAADEKAAVRAMTRTKKHCEVSRAVPTDRPFCNADRECGFDRLAEK